MPLYWPFIGQDNIVVDRVIIRESHLWQDPGQTYPALNNTVN